MQTFRILFLDSANYYRSRTAEELFNFLAAQEKLPWRAHSRGLGEIEPNHPQAANVSPLVVQFLEAKRVPVMGQFRPPAAVASQDLVRYERIICLDRVEHYPIMSERFSFWADRVEYWDVPDLKTTPEYYALPRLYEHIQKLLEELTLAGLHLPQRQRA